MSKSFYILELSGGLGGEPRGEVYVYRHLDHIRAVLESEVLIKGKPTISFSTYMDDWFCQTIMIWVVERGEVSKPHALYYALKPRPVDG